MPQEIQRDKSFVFSSTALPKGLERLRFRSVKVQPSSAFIIYHLWKYEQQQIMHKPTHHL